MKQFITILLTSIILVIFSACAKEETPNCRTNALGTYQEIVVNAPRNVITIEAVGDDKAINLIWSVENSPEPTYTLSAEISENCNIIDIPAQTTDDGRFISESILTVLDDRIQGEISISGSSLFHNSIINVLKR